MKEVFERIIDATSNIKFKTAALSKDAKLDEVDGSFIEETSGSSSGGGGGGVKRIEAEINCREVHSDLNCIDTTKRKAQNKFWKRAI